MIFAKDAGILILYICLFLQINLVCLIITNNDKSLINVFRSMICPNHTRTVYDLYIDLLISFIYPSVNIYPSIRINANVFIYSSIVSVFNVKFSLSFKHQLLQFLISS